MRLFIKILRLKWEHHYIHKIGVEPHQKMSGFHPIKNTKRRTKIKYETMNTVEHVK